MTSRVLTTTVAKIVACVLVACVVWTTSGAAMLLLPGSPHYQLLQSMRRLDSFRTDPESPNAAVAFDQFLQIGDRAHLVEVTLLPAFAAAAVALLLLWLGPLSAWEIVAVVAGFAAWLTLRTGLRYFGLLDVLGIGVFGVLTWIGRYCGIKRRPRTTSVLSPDA